MDFACAAEDDYIGFLVEYDGIDLFARAVLPLFLLCGHHEDVGHIVVVDVAAGVKRKLLPVILMVENDYPLVLGDAMQPRFGVVNLLQAIDDPD